TAKHGIDTPPRRQRKGARDPGRTTWAGCELAHLGRCSRRGRSQPWQDKNIGHEGGLRKRAHQVLIVAGDAAARAEAMREEGEKAHGPTRAPAIRPTAATSEPREELCVVMRPASWASRQPAANPQSEW